MPPTQPRNPIVCTGFDVSRQPVPVKGSADITKIVHFQNFEGGYGIGLSVATHKSTKMNLSAKSCTMNLETSKEGS